MEIVFKTWPEEGGGYGAHAAIDNQDLFTQGETLDELHANVLDVVLLFLQDLG